MPEVVKPGALSKSSYVVRPFLQDIPLSPEDHAGPIRITCVELCEGNLYIGTSRAEILHFVSIPPDPSDTAAGSAYIFASRLQPTYNAQNWESQASPGIQQLLVLPSVQKACVLCNGTLSFYTLPELSPAFGNTTVPNCTWVGGTDLSVAAGQEDNGIVVMVCVKSKVRLVRIREEARRVKDIEFPGCLISVRRGSFACVADTKSYALLDIDNQQKVSLFPISSLDENAGGGKIEDISTHIDPSDRPRSATRLTATDAESKSHGRSTSLGALVGTLSKRPGSPRQNPRDLPGRDTPEAGLQDISAAPSGHIRAGSTPESPNQISSMGDKPLPAPPGPPPRSSSLRAPPTAMSQQPLKPHICSPTPGEFLLVTGTSDQEAGVGIFVNLDGDVVRGTLEFATYPSSVVIDARTTAHQGAPFSVDKDQEGNILALETKADVSRDKSYVEIQRWDAEAAATKEILHIPRMNGADNVGDEELSAECGMRTVSSTGVSTFPLVGELLSGRRLKPSTGVPLTRTTEKKEEWEISREKEEADFGRRLGICESSIALWAGSSIAWIVRNPLAIRLEASIAAAITSTSSSLSVDRHQLAHIVDKIHGQEASTEEEFLSLQYVRQKISLLLTFDLILQPSSSPFLPTIKPRKIEDILLEGGIDPRVILSLLPVLNDEIVEGSKGIWIHAGLIPTIDESLPIIRNNSQDAIPAPILEMLKRYLMTWRQRKGFGSIPDEREVFSTVDAGLLRILLLQENIHPSQKSKSSAQQTELYALVDSGIDCFERAVTILEQSHRLYVLSRLYQSKRMARKVLETWRRIIEGQRDDGGGLVDGENEVRRYLVNIRDTSLVDEYGTWLAARNPVLGVQVFTSDNSRVKWEPHQVVMLLRRKAPDAVKEYLEHLVFGKKNVQYANDLISYYLDSVLTVLGQSEEARNTLSQSYETYRALRPPKPTYRQFIIENALPASWWNDRLRLLELIGGSHGSDFSYDVGQVLGRIEPFEQDLVPESIILDGRQGRHKQALRLLIHGLGDYHTAINYCLLGGASIFHPAQGSVTSEAAPSQEEQAMLFNHLLVEFLRIEDISNRLERTSELLGRFSSWYDVREVLDLIPETWSVELVAGFLVSSFRRLVYEKNEAMITKALSGAQNLQIASSFIEKCTVIGPQTESVPMT